MINSNIKLRLWKTVSFRLYANCSFLYAGKKKIGCITEDDNLQVRPDRN
jgi:hypothetical protein